MESILQLAESKRLIQYLLKQGYQCIDAEPPQAVIGRAFWLRGSTWSDEKSD